LTTRQLLAQLEASLMRRFRVVRSEIPIAGRTLSILHPASAEDLIDEEDFSRDERLPYWAELWPSARVLAEHVAHMDGAGRTALELGCGAGLVSTSASLAGFSVLASDYYEDAARFARVNARRNHAPPVRAMMLDWRHLPPELERFDLVLASDVLYERPYGDVVAGVIAATLKDGGLAIVADPGRVGREAFLAAFPEHGLAERSRQDVPFVDGVIRQTITLFHVGRAK
jgi:ETFB lysine methyltransferase